MSDKTLISQIGSGLKLLKKKADTLEVLGFGEPGNGEGKGHTIEMDVRCERSCPANLEDAFWVCLGFEKRESCPGFLFAG